MLTFFIHYRWVGETVAPPLRRLRPLLQQGHLMGVLDDNMDNKLQLAELRGKQAQSLKTNFASIDANKDGSLDKNEIATARGGGRAQLLRQRRRTSRDRNASLCGYKQEVMTLS